MFTKLFFRKLKNRYSSSKIVLFVKKIFTPYYQKYIFNDNILNNSNNVYLDWPNEVIKPKIGLIKDFANIDFIPYNAYWPRFEKFLKNNNFEYILFNINEKNWLDYVKKCDAIIYRTPSEQYSQYEAKMKIWFIENILKKKVLPNYKSLWFYEDKIAQYYILKELGLPVIDTFISFSYSEAKNYIEYCNYPFVSKLTTGSGSLGVEIVKNKREAKRIVNKIFNDGYVTGYSYFKQKDYVYFQKFLENCEYDLRVIVIGNKLFGYYRLTPKDDFRASGAGLVVKKEIPVDALDFTYNVVQKLGVPFLAVDLLKDVISNQYLINEVSVFIQVDTDEQLHVDGKPGYYERVDEGKYIFKEGKYWIQEFILEEFLKREYLNNR